MLSNNTKICRVRVVGGGYFEVTINRERGCLLEEP